MDINTSQGFLDAVKAAVLEQLAKTPILGQLTLGSRSKPVYIDNGELAECNEMVDTTSAQTISGEKTFSGIITSTLMSNQWNRGANGTAIIHAPNVGFGCLACMKSTNGAFIHGRYNDRYFLAYMDDEKIAAGDNGVNYEVRLLDEDGMSTFRNVTVNGTLKLQSGVEIY